MKVAKTTMTAPRKVASWAQTVDHAAVELDAKGDPHWVAHTLRKLRDEI